MGRRGQQNFQPLIVQPPVAERQRKTKAVPCPICSQAFQQRPDGRPVTCSKKCARIKGWREGRFKAAGPTFKHPQGYVWRNVPCDYPGAFNRDGRKNGWILDHRYVMQEHLLKTEGRLLDPRERVHHKNGRRDDNRLENLELWTLDHKDPPGVRVSDRAHCPTCTCPCGGR